MRCNRRAFAKLKSFLLLTAVLTSLIIVITFVNRRPGILRGMQFDERAAFRYANGGGGGGASLGGRPGGFLASNDAANTSYCSFGYQLPYRFHYDASDVEVAPELQAKSPYRVLYNVVEAQPPPGGGNHTSPTGPTDTGSWWTSVTYATHVTPEFVDYVSEVARTWGGAISVAAFVPDLDADMMTRHLLRLCECLPAMARVSVHYVFPIKQPPLHEPNLAEGGSPHQCDIVAGDSAYLPTFRKEKHLPYPVNLARNVARRAAITKHVLVSDVELIPSEGLAERFAEMMGRFAAKGVHFPPSRVFVVPVFEIEKYEEIPRTKTQLLKLIREEKALYFHRHICSHCQRFPGLENWLQHASKSEDIRPLSAVKREYPFHRWEPIYIGTKDEPFYSESLSWEGKQDKMTQMLEMCLKGYKFLILDNAFLVHWPGVKRRSNELKRSNKWRIPYLIKNTRQYNNIISNLTNKYARNLGCRVQ